MSEAEKQEGQKTVVAFIAGLLIGGLLVWIFSAPAEKVTPDAEPENEVSELTNETEDAEEMEADEEITLDVIGEGSVTAEDQAAGAVVALGETSFPTNNGWIVVRDYTDGVTGNILGASRYSTESGLVPESVNLLRATEAGNTYAVVFFTENGDRVFDLDDDTEIEGISSVFTAN